MRFGPLSKSLSRRQERGRVSTKKRASPTGARAPNAVDWCDEILARWPQNVDEAELETIEASWADFVYAVRTDYRIARAPGRRGLRVQGLRKLHRLFEDYRQQAAEGNRAAVFSRARHVRRGERAHAVWLANEILGIGAEVRRELKPEEDHAKGLHDLFGLAELYPVGGKKAAKARRDMRLRGELWGKVHTLISQEALALVGGKLGGSNAVRWQRERERIVASGIDRYITEARKQLKVPYEQRKARMMFEEQERIYFGVT